MKNCIIIKSLLSSIKSALALHRFFLPYRDKVRILQSKGTNPKHKLGEVNGILQFGPFLSGYSSTCPHIFVFDGHCIEETQRVKKLHVM
jgi:hypothetical protein